MDSKLLFPQGNYEISCTVNECKDMNLVLKNVIKQPVSLTKNEEIRTVGSPISGTSQRV